MHGERNEPAPGRRATLRDVAALAGVDASLVSRVINDDRKASASAETRQRILAAAEKLNYLPNTAARGLRMSRTWMLGLLVPSATNPMYADIMAGAEARAQRDSYGIVFRTHVEGEREEVFTRLLQQGRVDGLIIASGLMKDSSIRRIATGHGPVVLVNRRVDGVMASVTVDDEAGAALATRRLADVGHQAIGGLFGPPAVETSRRRRRGYSKVLRSCGLEQRAVNMPGWDFRSGYDGVFRLMTDHPNTTAIFASTMVMAVGALCALHELGRAVPADVSVVALHDSELASFTTPPLSTVKLPVYEMGEAAVDLLIKLINGGESESIVVEGAPEFIDRGSVAPPRST